MNLLNGRIGMDYQVLNVNLTRATEGRMQALGLTKGTVIKVLNRKRSGSIIFKVRGTRLAVGKEIAEAIEIREV